MIAYLLGVVLSFYLIGKNVAKNCDERDEFSGAIVCYPMALLSWLFVLVYLIMKLEHLSVESVKI